MNGLLQYTPPGFYRTLSRRAMVKHHARTVHSCEIGLLGNCHLPIKALGAIRTTLTGAPGPRRVHKRLRAFVVQKRRRLWCDNCCSRVIGPISGRPSTEGIICLSDICFPSGRRRIVFGSATALAYTSTSERFDRNVRLRN